MSRTLSPGARAIVNGQKHATARKRAAMCGVEVTPGGPVRVGFGGQTGSETARAGLGGNVEFGSWPRMATRRCGTLAFGQLGVGRRPLVRGSRSRGKGGRAELRRAYLLCGPELNPMLCNRIQSRPEQYRARQELPPVLATCCCLRPRLRPGPLQVPSRGEGACRVVWPAFAAECQDLGGHNDGWRGSNTESRRAGSKRMWCWAWPSEG